MPYIYHVKDVNNYNTFFGTDSHLQSISRQQCHNIIPIISLKLLKCPCLPFTSAKCAMSIFTDNILVCINFFSPFTPSS